MEDFLTEALAGVLESSSPLRASYVDFLVSGDWTVREVRVVSQGGSEHVRPDLTLEVSDSSGCRHLIVLEHKIDAPEGDHQLERYARWLLRQRDAASRTLVYVTTQRSTKLRDFPGINFITLRWFDIYNWLSDWVRNIAGTAGTELATELLALLDKWRLTMTLSANDLAAAVLYRNSVQNTLYRILNDVWNESSVDGANDNKWSYSDPKGITYRSPLINGTFRYRYGFDFRREDDDWNVKRLGLPSAFFAVWSENPDVNWERLVSWTKPPNGWPWESGEKLCRVKQIEKLNVLGTSLDGGYLEFFLNALTEAEQAIHVGGKA